MTSPLIGTLRTERTHTQLDVHLSTDAPDLSPPGVMPLRVVTTAHRYDVTLNPVRRNWSYRAAHAVMTEDPHAWFITVGLHAGTGPGGTLSAEDLADAMMGLSAGGAGVTFNRERTQGQQARAWTLLRREAESSHLIETYYAPGPLPIGTLTLQLHAALHRRAAQMRRSTRAHAAALHAALDEALQLTREAL